MLTAVQTTLLYCTTFDSRLRLHPFDTLRQAPNVLQRSSQIFGWHNVDVFPHQLRLCRNDCLQGSLMDPMTTFQRLLISRPFVQKVSVLLELEGVIIRALL